MRAYRQDLSWTIFQKYRRAEPTSMNANSLDAVLRDGTVEEAVSYQLEGIMKDKICLVLITRGKEQTSVVLAKDLMRRKDRPLYVMCGFQSNIKEPGEDDATWMKRHNACAQLLNAEISVVAFTARTFETDEDLLAAAKSRAADWALRPESYCFMAGEDLVTRECQAT